MLTSTAKEDPEIARILESTRIRLLGRIEDADTLRDTISMESLKEEYNHVVDKLTRYRRGPLPDPLVALPPELWIPIFQEYATADYMNGPAPSAIDNILILTLVSARWQEYIVRTPALWTCITVGQGMGEGDAAAKLGTALHLSNDLPITLNMCLTWENWDSALRLVQPHNRRVQEIRVYKAGVEAVVQVQALSGHLMRALSMFEALVNLKSVEAMYRRGFSLDWEDLLGKAPNLTSIHGFVIPAKFICLLNRSVRCIHTRETFWEILPFVYGLHSLQSITVVGGILPLAAPAFVDFPTPPSLTHIGSFDMPIGHGSVPISCIVPSLQNVTYFSLIIRQPKWNPLSDFIIVVDKLPQLVTLRMVINRQIEPFYPPPVIPVAFALRELLLDDGEPGGGRALVDEGLLYPMFSTSFQHIETLETYLGPSTESLLAYIGSLKRLQQVNLESKGHTCPPVYSSSIISFKIDIPPLSAPIVQLGLNCPNISTLTVRSASCVKLEPALFSKLEMLHIEGVLFDPSSSGSWEPTDLRSLRSVHFGATAFQVAKLFIHLTLWPDQLPFLDNIALDATPEWDLLFLMLERRRSVAAPNGVSQIKTLSLPSIPHLILLQPLIQIMRGLFAKRPSNQDISLAGLSEFIHDSSVLGCYRCLTSLQSCKKALLRTDQYIPRNDVSNDEIRPLQNTKLRADILLWLQGRGERYKRWAAGRERFHQSKWARVYSCHDVAIHKRCVIGG